MKYFHNLKMTWILLLLAVGPGACDTQGTAETMDKSINQTKDNAGNEISHVANKVDDSTCKQKDKVNVAIDDTVITARVKAAIYAVPALETLRISVDTENGEVTLSGSVESRVQKNWVNALAGSMSGVNKVNNLIYVKSKKI